MRDVNGRRFEREENGLVVFADYVRRDDLVFILHVEAPLPLRGTGAAGRLMRELVDKARADGFRLVPQCGYAAAWFRRNKDHADVIGG